MSFHVNEVTSTAVGILVLHGVNLLISFSSISVPVRLAWDLWQADMGYHESESLDWLQDGAPLDGLVVNSLMRYLACKDLT
jgi:hypothetical protein